MAIARPRTIAAGLCRGALALAAVAVVPALARAASFDCNASDLSDTRLMICGDAELSRTDDRIARRVRALQKRQGLGLYLSMRYWSFRAGEARDACAQDRVCVLAAYRAQAIALDRLQSCLDSGMRKRSCLRAVLSSEETASKNSTGRPAP